MPDVVDALKWCSVVADAKELADKYGSSFVLQRLPNGKEKVVVEIWYTPEKGKKS